MKNTIGVNGRQLLIPVLRPSVGIRRQLRDEAHAVGSLLAVVGHFQVDSFAWLDLDGTDGNVPRLASDADTPGFSSFMSAPLKMVAVVPSKEILKAPA